MTKVEKYTQLAIDIANDNSHGYSQANRWGTPDYDCSSLVISVCEEAGIPVKTNGATYTGNMLNVFLSCGFKDVTSSCNLSNGSGMIAGDILLNEASHAAMYIGSGQIVHARSAEGNSISGDQSGNEIRTQNYWNFPWDHILRYGETNNSSTTIINTQEKSTDIKQVTNTMKKITVIAFELSNGDTGEPVKRLQTLLNALGEKYNCGTVDGEFGPNTFAAVKKFQTNNGIVSDGIVGKSTWQAIIGYQSK